MNTELEFEDHAASFSKQLIEDPGANSGATFQENSSRTYARNSLPAAVRAECNAAAGRVPRKVKRRPRRSQARGRRSGIKRKAFERKLFDTQQSPEMPLSVYQPNISILTPILIPITLLKNGEKSRSRQKDDLDQREYPAWEYQDDLERLVFCNRALALIASSRGELTRAFTLRLTPQVIKAAFDNKNGVMDKIRRDIIRMTNAEVYSLTGSKSPVEILMGLGWDNHWLHVHGSFAFKDFELSAISCGLHKAGGQMFGHAKTNQLDLSDHYNPTGWAYYILKNMKFAKPHVEGRLWSVTRGARKEGRQLYDKFRQEFNAAAKDKTRPPPF